MIYELEPDEFQKTRRIFEPLTYHLAVDSIIEGFSKARVFADDTASPKSASTWFKSRAWIAGNANNDAFNRTLSSLLTDTYYRELSAHGAKEFRLHYTPGWQMKMDLIFGNLPRIEGIRYYFHLDAAARKWESVVVDDFRLCLINTEFLVSPKLRNFDYVIDEMQSERLSVEDFLQKSFGYCVLHDDEIVGWCMSEYNVGPRCELGIATIEAYRRRGVATMVGTAVIKHALVQGITDIGWHCWTYNRPSIATARKLGFIRRCEYPVYELSLERERTKPVS